jgi:hypothetical protein
MSEMDGSQIDGRTKCDALRILEATKSAEAFPTRLMRITQPGFSRPDVLIE